MRNLAKQAIIQSKYQLHKVSKVYCNTDPKIYLLYCKLALLLILPFLPVSQPILDKKFEYPPLSSSIIFSASVINKTQCSDLKSNQKQNKPRMNSEQSKYTISKIYPQMRNLGKWLAAKEQLGKSQFQVSIFEH